MKKMVLGCLLFISGLTYGQMPYDHDLENPRKCRAVYLLEKNARFTHYLRFFDFDFESVVYFHNSDTLCEMTSYSYHDSKQFFRKNILLDVKRVYRQDSLQFAVDVRENLYELVPMEDQVFHIQKVFELLKLPQNKGIFYKHKLTAFLQIWPVMAPVQVAQVIEPWHVFPSTNTSLVSNVCHEDNNLPCLCAALQFGTTNQKETAQQIASYLINRFTYGYGDTSQYSPVGLLTGDQNLAVCAGYSQMYELLLKKANIAAKYVDGAVRIELNDIFYSGHTHAWNELEIDGTRLCSDVTWANDLSSDWLLNTEENFFLSHFREPTGDSLWDKSYTRTMYEFMHQPMVRDPDKNAIENLQYVKNGMPMQFIEDEFTVRFSKSLPVSQVRFYELSYPFVQFETQKAEVTKLHLSDGKGGKYEKGAKAVSFTLKDQFTRVSLDVQGIGTLDYCVFNGSPSDFYRFVIDHIDAKSPYSVAMAFMACAKLNDVTRFQQLKPYLSNPKMSFKTFQKQAKTYSTADFQFALFNATRHHGTFDGFSFEYSNDKTEPRIYMSISEDEQSYSFTGFDTDVWDLQKK